MKRIISLLACALCLSLVLAGCGSKPTTGDDDKVIVLTLWHVYSSQTKSPLNDVIDEFNATAGKEAGVYINVTSVTDSGDIDSMLTATPEGQPGAMTLPDLFTAYPRVAELFPEDALLDWNDYLTEEQLSAYRSDFLSEGYFGEALYMLPIAKSSELLFVDKTLFDRFAAVTGVTLDCFNDMESLLAACDTYYDWSNGGTMFQINDFYHYFLVNMTGAGEEFVVDGKINAGSAAFEALFNELDRVENEKYRMLYSAVSEQYNGGYQFCTIPLFDGASDTQKSFETLMKSTLGAAHEEFVARVSAGEAGEAVMAELTADALSTVRAAVQ